MPIYTCPFRSKALHIQTHKHVELKTCTVTPSPLNYKYLKRLNIDMLPSIVLSITDMCYKYGIVMKLLFFIS